MFMGNIGLSFLFLSMSLTRFWYQGDADLTKYVGKRSRLFCPSKRVYVILVFFPPLNYWQKSTAKLTRADFLLHWKGFNNKLIPFHKSLDIICFLLFHLAI